MKRRDELNDAFAYLGGDLSASERLSYEDRLERSASARDGLTAAKQARGVWSAARAPLEDVSAERWAALDESVFRAVVQEKPVMAGFDWASFLPSGRTLAWTGAMAVLAIGLYAVISAIPQHTDGDVAPRQVASTEPSIEIGERGAIYAAGSHIRKVSAAAAIISIAPEAACHLAKLDGANTRVEVVAGSVTFDVDKRAKGETFEVTAADVLVRVIGTSFTVDRLESGSVRIDVAHGIVAVSRAGVAHVTLRAGETVTVKSSLQMVAEEPHSHHVAAPNKVAPRVVVSPQPAPEPTVAAAPKAAGRPVTRSRKRVRSGAKVAVREAVDVGHKPAADRSDDHLEAEPVVAEAPKATPAEAKPVAPVLVDTPTDAAGQELRGILASIGRGNDAAVVSRLKAWRKANRGHRGAFKARYAIGYCLFKMGDRTPAIRIFESVAAQKNPWVNTAGDYLNPPRPR